MAEETNPTQNAQPLKPGPVVYPETNNYPQIARLYPGLLIECIEEVWGPTSLGWLNVKRYTGPDLLQDLARLQEMGVTVIQLKLKDPTGQQPHKYPDYRIDELLSPV